MHPLLKSRNRLVSYIAVWVIFGVLLAVVLIYGGRAPMKWALEFAVPLAVLLGMQCL